MRKWTMRRAETDRIGEALIFDKPLAWRDEMERLEDIYAIPSMISSDEALCLYWLAKHYWSDRGVIVDLGPLAGGSTLALAAGLDDNDALAGRAGRIVAYDLWSYLKGFGPFFPGLGQANEGADLLPAYLENLGARARHVTAHKGDVQEARWCGMPIELIFVDLAKSPEIWLHVARQFFACAIPGHTILVNQDLISVDCPWIALYMQFWRDSFDYVDSPYGGTICYRFKQRIPPELIDLRFYETVSSEDACRLFDRTAAELRGWAAAFM